VLKHIATFNGLSWHLDADAGKVEGYKQGENEPHRVFWISNPPETKHLLLFRIVCDLAVDLGLLRRIPLYAVAK